MLDDFTKTQIKNISIHDPACIKTLIHTIRENINSLDCSVRKATKKEEQLHISHPENCVAQQLQNDFHTNNTAQELDQKKIISGLIRQKFVDTAINIPNKTTKSIIEWYLVSPM